MLNVLITGANGQLGSELKALVSEQYPISDTLYPEFYFTDRDTLDITDFEAIKSYINKNDIKIIINCAAYTAVDKAEDEVELADAINHKAVEVLANIAKTNHIKLIHVSTDYVFDGKNYKPYVETDITNPQSVYGKTKLDGENAILSIAPANAIIIRTSWVYSSFGNNFVKTMLRLGKERESLGVIFDQVGTPTYACDLAVTLLRMLSAECLVLNDKVEIYHYSNEGVASWYDFAKEIMKMAKIKCQINPIETKDYPTLAARPHYSLLNKAKIKKDFGLAIPYWKDSLSDCITKMMSGEG